MTKYDVGIENLPNVYINKININDSIGNSKKAIVQILIKDHYKNPAWSAPGQMADNLKIKYLFVYSGTADKANFDAITESINEGRESIMDYGTSGDNYVSFETGTFFKKYSDPVRDIEAYSDTLVADIPPCQNLILYVCCYYDFGQSIANEYFRHFAGPVFSEKILLNGTLVEKTKYFYFPSTNLPYGGPAHYSEINGFMEGSEHGDHSHERIVSVESKNRKVVKNARLIPLPEVNLNIINLLTEQRHQNISGRNIAAIKTYTLTEDDSALSLLHINTDALMWKSSPNAAILSVLNNNLFKKILPANFQLKSIDIVRRNLNVSGDIVGSTNLLGIETLGTSVIHSHRYLFGSGSGGETTVNFGNYNIKNSNRPQSDVGQPVKKENLYYSDLIDSTAHKIAEAYELGFKQNETIKTLLIEDSLYNFTADSFSYVVNIGYLETIDNYVISAMDSLSEAIINLDKLIIQTHLPSNYSYETEQYTGAYKNFVAEEYSIPYQPGTGQVNLRNFLSVLSSYKVSNNPYIFILGAFMDAYSLLASTDDRGLEQLILENILPFSTNHELLGFVKQGCIDLGSKIRDAYNVNPADTSTINSLGSENSIIILTFDFTESFPYVRTDLGYKLFSNNTAIAAYSKDQLKSRLEYEEKYYNNLRNNSDINLLSERFREIFNFNTMEKLNYITPLEIKIENSKISLIPPMTEIDSSKVMFFRLRAAGWIADASPNSTTGDTPFSSNVTNPTDPTAIGTGLSVSELDEDEAGIAVTPPVTINLPGGYTISYGSLFIGSDDETWFPDQESDLMIVNNFMAEDDTGTVFLDDYPPHHKAMMFENYGVSGYDMFLDNRFRRIIAETAMNVMKVHCITGFSRDSSGLFNLNSPEVKPLTESLLSAESPFFCYSTPHSPSTNFGLFKNTQAHSERTTPVPSLNNLAYVIGSVPNPNVSWTNQPSNNIIYQFRDIPEYYSTNIVKQDPNKSGVLSLFDTRSPSDQGAADDSAVNVPQGTNSSNTGGY